jgi:hypothetical protein
MLTATPEVLDRRDDRAAGRVAERAEHPADHVVVDVEQLGQVVLAAPARFQAFQ